MPYLSLAASFLLLLLAGCDFSSRMCDDRGPVGISHSIEATPGDSTVVYSAALHFNTHPPRAVVRLIPPAALFGTADPVGALMRPHLQGRNVELPVLWDGKPSPDTVSISYPFQITSDTSHVVGLVVEMGDSLETSEVGVFNIFFAVKDDRVLTAPVFEMIRIAEIELALEHAGLAGKSADEVREYDPKLAWIMNHPDGKPETQLSRITASDGTELYFLAPPSFVCLEEYALPDSLITLPRSAEEALKRQYRKGE